MRAAEAIVRGAPGPGRGGSARRRLIRPPAPAGPRSGPGMPELRPAPDVAAGPGRPGPRADPDQPRCRRLDWPEATGAAQRPHRARPGMKVPPPGYAPAQAEDPGTPLQPPG